MSIIRTSFSTDSGRRWLRSAVSATAAVLLTAGLTVTIASSAAASVVPAAFGVYTIKSAKWANSYMDVYGGSNAAGTKVVTYNPTGGDNQKFQLRPISEGYYFIVNMQSYFQLGESGDQCLDVAEASQDSGLTAPIIQWPCGNADSHNQHFKLVPVINGYKLQARHSGKFVSMSCLALACGLVQNTSTSEAWQFNDAEYTFNLLPVKKPVGGEYNMKWPNNCPETFEPKIHEWTNDGTGMAYIPYTDVSYPAEYVKVVGETPGIGGYDDAWWVPWDTTVGPNGAFRFQVWYHPNFIESPWAPNTATISFRVSCVRK